MAKLASNNNKAQGPWASVPFLPKLAFHDSHGDVWYYPLIEPTSRLTWGGYVYSYDRSVGDTFGIGLSGTKYVVPNKRVSANYDIPAGTYTTSTFDNLIRSFISDNGSRRVNNSFSVEVNGQTYKVSSGSSIYYTSQYGGQARFVCFNGQPRGWISFEQPGAFAKYGIYCTYWTVSDQQGNRCFQYRIQVNTGIKFK